ncbi:MULTISPECIES: heavy-metal-associated domain-containing protein [Tepidiphilus]|jgi:copper chaperone|uniref:Heavy-metal-associated domain-containing protein n=1 Tax=Tepidiphilus baoligensis TaxID=2698687 RepID=A0ABX1QPR8_9PROT|nr:MULTISPECIES: heavy metal-associated domain-containing protein [Tepidiphilus]NMH17101.1 heavy-metal-associated domain-containing protein [Tepidiphilus baoligensis]
MQQRYQVTGMSCAHCEKAVAEALKKVPGVERVVSVSREREEVVIEGDPSPQAVIEAILEEGYDAKLV